MSGADDPLVAVLDELLPGQSELPPAGAMGLAERVRADAAAVPSLRSALTETLRRLPNGFSRDSPEARVRALQSLERDHPRAFGGLLNLAYNAYYTDGRVLARIEAQTGYGARAPQPAGYTLPPFDERLLEHARRHPPSWRQP